MSAWIRKALPHSQARAAMRIAVVSGSSVDNASATRLARCQLSHAAAISRLANHGSGTHPIDAEAVARVVLREPDLPVASHDEVSRECRLLVDRREDLVGQRTATVNRLVWRIHEL